MAIRIHESKCMTPRQFRLVRMSESRITLEEVDENGKHLWSLLSIKESPDGKIGVHLCYNLDSKLFETTGASHTLKAL